VVLPALYGEFFSELIRGIDQGARQHGYHLLVSSHHGHIDEQRNALQRLHGRVDGVLVMSPCIDESGLFDGLPAGLPTVLLNSGPRSDRYSVLAVDSYGGARTLVRHLIDEGHRRIAFVCGPPDNFDAHERLRGYRDEIAHAGLSAWELPGLFDEASGYRAGQALAHAEPRPDAVFAANDMMALGCLFAFNHAGLQVPNDIALAGFDDVPMARYVHPALTTMHVDIAGLGARGLQLLIDQLSPANDAVPTAPSISGISPELIVRASCAPRRPRMG
jgi:LacI family transcriptional regulator